MVSETRMAPMGEKLLNAPAVNRQRKFKLSSVTVALFCENVLKTFSSEARELTVVLVSSAQMRSINQKYLNHDYATDVLSFSYEGILVEGRKFPGEIIVAPEVAAVHASAYGVSPEEEIRKLLVHGILHLLGYNHETDRGQMNRLQKRLLRRKLSASASIWRQ